MQWKTRVAAADSSDEMIFKGLNGALRRVGLVQVGGHKLKCDSRRRIKLFRLAGNLLSSI